MKYMNKSGYFGEIENEKYGWTATGEVVFMLAT